MAVEKMTMVSLVGRIDDLDQIMQDVLGSESVDIVDAMTQLGEINTVYDLGVDDLDMIMELNNLGPFRPERTRRNISSRAKELMDYYGIKEISQNSLGKEIKTLDELNRLYKGMSQRINLKKEVEERLDQIQSFQEGLANYDRTAIDFNKLKDLEYFSTRFGRLDKTSEKRLRANFENILGLFFHTGSYQGEEYYMVIYPNEVGEEIDRILKSSNWVDAAFMDDIVGNLRESIASLKEEEQKLREKLALLNEERENDLKYALDEIEQTLASSMFHAKTEELKRKMARSENYFILFGWIGQSDLTNLKKTLEVYPGLSITTKEGEEDGISPPTKLRNSGFFKPFEALVRLYGTPNYRETDPTKFLGLTYMILFGAMFGDVGQGLVFALIGLWVSRTKNQDIGGILTRLGISSTLFGFVYGSVFGSEILPALWIRPFDSINTVLLTAVGFGVILLGSSYVISFINAIKNRDIRNGIFGKNGLAGFLVFLTMLFLIIDLATGLEIIPKPITISLMILAILLIIFQTPVMAALEKREADYGHGKGLYYVEGSFSIIELLISTLAGIVSFIRVGAFAINHTGLYLAFVTMGQMTGSKAGNIVLLILGNILIMGLEGLIVVIQGLRLEYYELFSRYYRGDGVEFKPSTIELTQRDI